MFIGEALAGDGNEIAHIDLLDRQQGTDRLAWRLPMPWPAKAKATPTCWPSSTPNLAIKPATVMVTKVTIKGMRQAVQMFGPAQSGRSHGHGRFGGRGSDPRKINAEELVCICGVFIHPEADRRQEDSTTTTTKPPRWRSPMPWVASRARPK